MRVRILIFFALVFSSPLGHAQPDYIFDQEKLEARAAELNCTPGSLFEDHIQNTLRVSMYQWGEQPSEEIRLKCEFLIDQFFTETMELSPEPLFLAAKSAELLGMNEKAISLLELSIHHLGDDIAPQFPLTTVKTAANMWLGRLARDTGDYEKAIAAFEEAAKDKDAKPKRHLAATCLLAIGEIQGVLMDDKEAALATLRKIEPFLAEVTSSASHPRFHSEYAKRLIDEINGKPTESVCPPWTRYGTDTNLSMYGKLDGTTFNPMSLFHPKDLHGLMEYNLINIAENTRSQVERDICLITLASFYNFKENYAEAEKILKKMFSSSAFLAPFAGEELAKCYSKQKKIDQMDAVLESLVERWPFYELKAKQTREQLMQPPPSPEFIAQWKKSSAPAAANTSTNTSLENTEENNSPQSPNQSLTTQIQNDPVISRILSSVFQGAFIGLVVFCLFLTVRKFMHRVG